MRVTFLMYCGRAMKLKDPSTQIGIFLSFWNLFKFNTVLSLHMIYFHGTMNMAILSISVWNLFTDVLKLSWKLIFNSEYQYLFWIQKYIFL